MFSVNSMVQIYDHTEQRYTGKIGVIRTIETIRGHVFYMVEIDNHLVPCTSDELIEY